TDGKSALDLADPSAKAVLTGYNRLTETAYCSPLPHSTGWMTMLWGRIKTAQCGCAEHSFSTELLHHICCGESGHVFAT
ncbi:hypothetical protein Nmel_006940, partial [Mimus melanotis]